MAAHEEELKNLVAYDEGVDSAECGFLLENNPYKQGTKYHAAWALGYERADKELDVVEADMLGDNADE